MPLFRKQCFLIKNGIPFEAVDLLSDAEVDAYFITFQELESGKSFNWEYMVWPEPDND